MTTPKTHKDEIDWLVIVWQTSNDEALKKEALEKLLAYGLNKKQIIERFARLNTEKDQELAFEKAWKIHTKRNETKKYTPIEMIRIFLFGPYDLFKYFRSGLKELREENYKIKFRQRVILLITGTIFWILLTIGAYQYSQYRRMKKIEKVDITNWENNRIEKK